MSLPRSCWRATAASLPGVERLLPQLRELLEALLDRVRHRRDGRPRAVVAVQRLGFGLRLDLGLVERHAARLEASSRRRGTAPDATRPTSRRCRAAAVVAVSFGSAPPRTSRGRCTPRRHRCTDSAPLRMFARWSGLLSHMPIELPRASPGTGRDARDVLGRRACPAYQPPSSPLCQSAARAACATREAIRVCTARSRSSRRRPRDCGRPALAARAVVTIDDVSRSAAAAAARCGRRLGNACRPEHRERHRDRDQRATTRA